MKYVTLNPETRIHFLGLIQVQAYSCMQAERHSTSKTLSEHLHNLMLGLALKQLTSGFCETSFWIDKADNGHSWSLFVLQWIALDLQSMEEEVPYGQDPWMEEGGRWSVRDDLNLLGVPSAQN